MTSLLSSLFTLLLFSKICGTPVGAAGSYDDDGGRSDQESTNAVVEDIDGVGSEMAAVANDRGFRGHRTHGPGPAFSRSRAALSNPNTDQTPGDPSVKIDRRESDLNMLQCMIGRVYRPCWQA
ncbi:hypothetical protein CRUP_030076 [Coryphaenoides rupestris]|nr:hypothetical protein CRUP_030076 [Coryphaenoides rupestris]